MKNKFIAIILGIFLIAGIVAISGCTDSSGSNNGQPAINVTNLKVTSEGYDTYDITGQIVPNKDESYLEMATIWYDSSGSIVYKDSLAWNINDAKSGQKLKVKATDYVNNGNPAKVQVLIFDSAWDGSDESSAIYSKNLTV